MLILIPTTIMEMDKALSMAPCPVDEALALI